MKHLILSTVLKYKLLFKHLNRFEIENLIAITR